MWWCTPGSPRAGETGLAGETGPVGACGRHLTSLAYLVSLRSVREPIFVFLKKCLAPKKRTKTGCLLVPTCMRAQICGYTC